MYIKFDSCYKEILVEVSLGSKNKIDEWKLQYGFDWDCSLKVIQFTQLSPSPSIGLSGIQFQLDDSALLYTFILFLVTKA